MTGGSFQLPFSSRGPGLTNSPRQMEGYSFLLLLAIGLQQSSSASAEAKARHGVCYTRDILKIPRTLANLEDGELRTPL